MALANPSALLDPVNRRLLIRPTAGQLPKIAGLAVTSVVVSTPVPPRTLPIAD